MTILSAPAACVYFHLLFALFRYPGQSLVRIILRSDQRRLAARNVKMTQRRSLSHTLSYMDLECRLSTPFFFASVVIRNCNLPDATLPTLYTKTNFCNKTASSPTPEGILL